MNGELTFELIGLKSKIYIVKSLTIAKKQEKRESTQIVGLKIKPEINLESLQQQKSIKYGKVGRIAQDSQKLDYISSK